MAQRKCQTRGTVLSSIFGIPSGPVEVVGVSCFKVFFNSIWKKVNVKDLVCGLVFCSHAMMQACQT